MGSKHNPRESSKYARTPIRCQPPQRLTAAGGQGYRPPRNLGSSPIGTCYVKTHYYPVGYPMEFTGIRGQVLPQPLNIQTVGTCYGWYQACFQTSQYTPGWFYRGEKRHFKEYCEVFIHNTPEAQELQLPHTIFPPPSTPSPRHPPRQYSSPLAGHRD